MDILIFIEQYYYLVLLALFIIILSLELLILFVKKKDPSVLSGINSILPSLIKQAEDKYGSGTGPIKFQYVIVAVKDYLHNVFNIQNVNTYEKYIINKVDEILSTPHKKEDI